jgi:hypothetical protein
MRALVLNCTLKPSPSRSNTDSLADVVVDALEKEQVEVTRVRLADLTIKPGVTSDEDGAHHVISEIAGGLGDIGYTIPGQAWTYWNKGPGPGPSYNETGEGHDWSAKTGRAMASNLVAVAKALAANPVPAPSS